MIADILATLKRSWSAHFLINFATSGVLALSFGIIFGSILFSHNISRIMAVWGEEIQITVYLKDNVSDEQLQNLLTSIKADNHVSKFTYIDKSTAAKTFEASLKSYGPHFLAALKSDVGNPFPASFQVQLKPEFKNPEVVEKVSHGLSLLPGVEDISYGQEWVSNYTTLMKYSRVLALVFGVVIMVSCLFTISNSIRASLTSRREEIEILELVGATPQMIRKPFLIEGAFQGLLAAALALILLGAIYTYLVSVLEKTVGAAGLSQSLAFFPFTTVALMVLSGAIIGALGSYVCVAKINTGWAASQGIKA